MNQEILKFMLIKKIKIIIMLSIKYEIVILIFTIVIQPDFSTAAVIGLIGISMLFIGGARLSHITTTAITAVVVMITVMLMKPYRMKRVIYWLVSVFGFNGNSAQEGGYQAQQSLISLGNGVIGGLGLGNSLEKNLFLHLYPFSQFYLKKASA